MASDSTKPYYLTAAPQCPLPDASIPVPELLESIDFFSVQFYNNPACQLNAGQGFLDSVQDWSDMLSGVKPFPPRQKMAMKKRRQATSSQRRGVEKLRNGAAFPRTGKNGKRQATDDIIDVDFFQLDNGISTPQLLIGAPAFNWAEDPSQNTGYVDVATYKEILLNVREKNLPNLAGAMFWDGGYQSRSAQEVDGESLTYAQVVRDVLRIPH
jgi:hypothetical protein